MSHLIMRSETSNFLRAGRASLPGPEICMVEIVFPNDANHQGTLFGGRALAWMDKAAFVAATRFARAHVVTVRSDGVDFKHPVSVVEIAELRARVLSVGRSSIRVAVQLWSEQLLSGARQLATEGTFVMVSVKTKQPQAD